VVLDHVAQRAGLLVVAAPTLQPAGFRHRDLHVIDPVPVPERFEDRVAEPEDEEVLHRLLPQVVVDPVDLFLAEVLVDGPVQRLRRRAVAAERLLHDQARPTRAAMETRAPQPPHGRPERRRREREVEDAVPGKAVRRLDLLDAARESGELLGRPVPRRVVVEALVAPDPELRVGDAGLAQRRAGHRAEGGIVRLAFGADAEHDDVLRPAAPLDEPEECRQELAPGEIPAGAEDDEEGTVTPLAGHRGSSIRIRWPPNW